MRVTASHVADEERTAEGVALTALVLEIFRANGRLLRAGDALSRDFGLTSARWQVLGAIITRPKTVAQIARDFELTRQGVLWVVQALLKDDLIELIRNPDHKRAKLVRLTAKGSSILAELLERQHAWVDDLGASFTIDELRVCHAVMTRLGNLVGSSDADSDI